MGNSQNEAGKLIQSTRRLIADLCNIDNPNHISFTHNATHSINIALKGFLKKGDHIIVSSLEHNAVLRPLRKLKQERNISFDIWESDHNGLLNNEKLIELIKPNTRLIVINHRSNVLGTIAPLEAIGAIAKRNHILFMADCSQTIALIPIKTTKWNLDILVGTAHKSLLGPPGVGFLYIKDDTLVDTLYEGGGGYDSISDLQPAHMPLKFEAGTMNYIGIVGLKSCIEYLKPQIRKSYEKYMALAHILFRLMASIKSVTLYTKLHMNSENRLPILLFNIENLSPAQVSHILESSYGIQTRPGLQCAPLAHKTISTFPQGAVRVSIGYNNTEQDIHNFYYAIKKIIKEHS